MNNVDYDPEIFDVDSYGNIVKKKLSEVELNPEANGFHDVPAECEDLECAECPLNPPDRKALDCPYVDESN